MRPILVLVLAVLPLTSGCVAKSIYDVATMPIRTTSQAVNAAGTAINATSTTVDVLTESQSERDEKRGRDLRRREEAYGRLSRDYRHKSEQCEDGNRRACDESEAIHDEMERLRGGIPAY